MSLLWFLKFVFKTMFYICHHFIRFGEGCNVWMYSYRETHAQGRSLCMNDDVIKFSSVSGHWTIALFIFLYQYLNHNNQVLIHNRCHFLGGNGGIRQLYPPKWRKNNDFPLSLDRRQRVVSLYVSQFSEEKKPIEAKIRV